MILLPQSSAKILTLDDVLDTILNLRAQFKLPEPHFGLKEMERAEAPRKALREILEATKKRYGSGICSKRHFLLKDLGPGLYAREIRGESFSGYFRFTPRNVDRVLRRVLEIALQTLFQLPPCDPKLRAKDKLVALASQLRRLAAKFDSVVLADGRIKVYRGGTKSAERRRLLALSTQLRRGAEILTAVSTGTRVVRIRMDSANPQVRFALYLAGWIEAATGRKHYAQLKILAAEAFAAGDRHHETPKWIDRLEIEMNRKIKRRRRLAK